MNLDTTDAVPLYQQLTDIIREEIENGVYKKGEKIPTEQELARDYSVSRVTVRNALNELTKQNLLIRKRGKGTFVQTNKLVRSITGVRSFTDTCREMGCRPGGRAIKCVIEDATPEDIAELELEPGARVIVIERIRYADEVPVSFEISRFPERFSYLLQENLNDCSMFEILREKYNVILVNSSKTLELIYANYETSVYLDVPEGYPLLSITSLSKDGAGLPAHRSMQYIVGDKFKLIL